MKIKFDEKEHKYFLGKKELVSITTLLKRHGLATDFSEVMISPAVLADARDRGNLIHQDWSNYIKKGIIPSTKEGLQILDWYNKHQIATVAKSEYIVYNNELAGTIDFSFLQITKPELTAYLTDIKTGKKVDMIACSWQLSLYEYLEEKQYDQLLILHTPKGEDLEVIEVPRISKAEIEKLLECERNAELYNQPKVELATVSAEISSQISIGLKAIKKIEKELAEYKDRILIEMRDKGIKKFDNGEVSITYIEPTNRETIDTKALKADLPEIAEKYKKISSVKDSIKINIKGE